MNTGWRKIIFSIVSLGSLGAGIFYAASGFKTYHTG